MQRSPFDPFDVHVDDVLRVIPDGRPCGFCRTKRNDSDRVRGYYTGPCRNWNCPNCVVEKALGYGATFLSQVGSDPVAVKRFADIEAEVAFRDKRGIKLRGPNATPWLSLPAGSGEERIAFVPEPGGLTGKKLGRKLADAIRQMLVPPPRVRKPDAKERDENVVTHTYDRELIEEAAIRAGFELRWKSPRRWESVSTVTRTQWDYFKMCLRDVGAAPPIAA